MVEFYRINEFLKIPTRIVGVDCYEVSIPFQTTINRTYSHKILDTYSIIDRVCRLNYAILEDFNDRDMIAQYKHQYGTIRTQLPLYHPQRQSDLNGFLRLRLYGGPKYKQDPIFLDPKNGSELKMYSKELGVKHIARNFGTTLNQDFIGVYILENFIRRVEKAAMPLYGSVNDITLRASKMSRESIQGWIKLLNFTVDMCNQFIRSAGMTPMSDELRNEIIRHISTYRYYALGKVISLGGL